jgi:glycerol-3-phosphate acyltransferase PlsY
MIGIPIVIFSYLLGSIPSAYIMARVRQKVDIRRFGTGNVGAANVIRHIGVWEGIVVGLTDIAKGALGIYIGQLAGLSQLWIFGAGFGVLLGHNFPCFIGFKGGKGAAVMLGIFLMLFTKETGIIVGIIVFLLLAIRNFDFVISLGLAFLPLIIWLFDRDLASVIYATTILIFIGLRSLPFIDRVWPWRSRTLPARDKANGQA